MRSVQAWLAKGRETGTAPPLGDPAALLLWLRSWSRRPPPAGVVAAAEGLPPALELAGVMPEPAPEADAEAAGMVVPVIADQDAGVDVGLRQAQALVAATWEELQAAIKGGRTSAAARLRREWREAVVTLRQWEKDITKLREERGSVLRSSRLAGEVSIILGVIAQSFAVALQDGIAAAAPGMQPDEVRRRALTLRDACFKHLRETRFATAWSGPTSTALNGG